MKLRNPSPPVDHDTPPATLSRRRLLKLTAAAAAVTAVPASAQISVRLPGAEVSTPSKKPKHVLFCVSDGMAVSVPTLAEAFSQQTRNRSTRWYQLLNDPNVVNGFLHTESLNSLVTDSAAASSAWASGHKINNAQVNTLPDGTTFTPILALAKQRGLTTGLVTTDDMCGATPACFACVHADRHAYDELAPQYLNTVDILMGGGRNNFDPAARPDHLDLIGRFKQHGYSFFDQRDQLLASKPTPRLLGLFNDVQLPFTIDHINDPQLQSRVPTLAEMTRHTLACIADARHGSLVQIEGARIDQACHANDFAGALHDQLAFDDAITLAIDFAQKRDDTLVIITADHATAGPELNGWGHNYTDSTPSFDRLAQSTASTEQMRKLIVDAAKQTDPVAAAKQTLAQHAGFDITDDEAAALADSIVHDDQPHDLNRQQRNWVATLGQVLGNHTAVQWTSVSHTGEWVILSALGPGCERFTGIRHHTDVFGILADLLQLPAKTAGKYLSRHSL
jgi:alkaline phosphatase